MGHVIIGMDPHKRSCKTSMASDRPAPPGCSVTSVTSPDSLTAATSPPGTAPRPSTPPPATSSATGSRGPATGASTGCCTSWPSSSSATTPKAAPTIAGSSPTARPAWKPSGASNDGCPGQVYRQMINDARASATGPEDTRGRLLALAWPACTPAPALQKSHFPDPPSTTYASTPIHSSGCSRRPPLHAGPQPPSSAVCLTAARTGAHSQAGNNHPLDIEGSHERTFRLGWPRAENLLLVRGAVA